MNRQLQLFSFLIAMVLSCNSVSATNLGQVPYLVVRSAVPGEVGQARRILPKLNIFGTDNGAASSYDLNVFTRAALTSTTTLSATSATVQYVSASSGWALTLPAANATDVAGKIFFIKKTDNNTNAITLTAAGGDTIDGAATVALNARYQFIAIQSDGTATWNVIGRFKTQTVTSGDFVTGIDNNGDYTHDVPSGAGQVIPLGSIFDGGGAAISTGVKGWIRVPFNCTIQDVELVADQSGSIVIDIWKKSYTNVNYPTAPTSSDSITASAKPTISSSNKSKDSTLTGWTTSVSADDWLFFNVVSCTTITRASLAIKAVRN